MITFASGVMSRLTGSKAMHVAVRLLGLGWYVAVCIVLGVLGGVWLDERLGVTPLFILLGVGLALIVAGWGAYRMAAPLLSQNQPARKDNEE